MRYYHHHHHYYNNKKTVIWQISVVENYYDSCSYRCRLWYYSIVSIKFRGAHRRNLKWRHLEEQVFMKRVIYIVGTIILCVERNWNRFKSVEIHFERKILISTGAGNLCLLGIGHGNLFSLFNALFATITQFCKYLSFSTSAL